MHGPVPYLGHCHARFLHHCSKEVTFGHRELNSYVTLPMEGFYPPSLLHAASLLWHKHTFLPNPTARAQPPNTSRQPPAASRQPPRLILVSSSQHLSWAGQSPSLASPAPAQAEQTRPRWTLALSQRTAGVRTQARLMPVPPRRPPPSAARGPQKRPGPDPGRAAARQGGAETRKHRWGQRPCWT